MLFQKIFITLVCIFCINSIYGGNIVSADIGAGYSCPSILGNETYFKQRCSLRLNASFCDTLWLNFSQVWNNDTIDLTTITEADYQPYIGSFDWKYNKNVIFWSGTGACPIDIVHNLTAQYNFTSLEDLNAAFIVTDSHWCTPDKFANGTCAGEWPSEMVTTNGSSRAFWKAASRKFATVAAGNIYMLIKALAYRNTSTFSGVELPTLSTHSQDVLSYHIMVVTDIANYPSEVCGNGTLKQLVSDVKSKLNLTDSQVTCVNDPPCVLRIMCYNSNFTDSVECKGFTKYLNDFRCDFDTLNAGSSSAMPSNNNLVLIICLSIAGVILFILVVIVIVKKRRSDASGGYVALKS